MEAAQWGTCTEGAEEEAVPETAAASVTAAATAMAAETAEAVAMATPPSERAGKCPILLGCSC